MRYFFALSNEWAQLCVCEEAAGASQAKDERAAMRLQTNSCVRRIQSPAGGGGGAGAGAGAGGGAGGEWEGSGRRGAGGEQEGEEVQEQEGQEEQEQEQEGQEQEGQEEAATVTTQEKTRQMHLKMQTVGVHEQ